MDGWKNNTSLLLFLVMILSSGFDGRKKKQDPEGKISRKWKREALSK